ncbi:hypothetical protein [Methanobacterium formicicum]|uniref:hypothetical protein n=1 Tax=Methanobacterium formicicum TaxID=2162 RepID=UPI0024123270|nr:hypothetical protein [Methanobacterium formicicum]MDG3547254.1 hypothetical protein [Methanobacterium formicicum]
MKIVYCTKCGMGNENQTVYYDNYQSIAFKIFWWSNCKTDNGLDIQTHLTS